MEELKNIQSKSIRKQLIQIVFVGVGIILLTITLTLTQIYRINSETQDINDKKLKVSNLCLKIDGAIGDVIALNQSYLVSKRSEIREEADMVWKESIIKNLDSLLVLAHKLEDTQLSKNAAKLLEEANRLETYLVSLEKYDISTDKEEITLLDIRIQQVSKLIHSRLYNIYRLEEREIAFASKKIETYSNYMIYIAIFSGIVFILLGGIFVYRVFQRIIKFIKYLNDKLDAILNGVIPENPDYSYKELNFITQSIIDIRRRFRLLKTLAEEVSAQNFDTDVRVFDDKGELGAAIKGMRKSLASISKANQERNWTNEGISKLSEVLRRDDQADFYNQVISNLVNYLAINQGGIFVLDDETDPGKPVMVLKAAYAFKKDKFFKKEIPYGENLVGTAWREKDVIYMSDVPESYPNITSGLGGARPRNILIVPLVSNEQVLGIVELASFDIFEEYQIDFVKRLSESIAITIARVKINSSNRQILESSKQLAEELKRKEVEYKQNLDQLGRLREAAKKTQNELDTRMDALNQAFAIMEITPEGRLLEVNERLLEISGYEEDDLIGQSFTVLLRESLRDIKDAWADLLSGAVHVGDFKRYTKSGRLYWMNEVIFPVMNKEGKAERIFSIGYEITTQKEQEKLIKRQLKAMQSADVRLMDDEAEGDGAI